MSDPRPGLLKKALDALSLAAVAVGELDEHDIPGAFGDPLDTEQIISGLAEVSADLRDALQLLEEPEPEPGIEDFEWEEAGEDDDWDEEEDGDDDFSFPEPWEAGDDEADDVDTDW